MHCANAVQRRQQHPLARQRSAVRVLRSQIAQSPAGQFDHAGQSEPGDVRVNDAIGRTRDRQRRLDHGRAVPPVGIFN